MPLTMVELRHLGGALSRHPRHDNAVSGRSAGYLLGVVGGVADEAAAERVSAAAGAVLDAVLPWTQQEFPVNYLHVPQPDNESAWDQQTRERLARVKSRFDPDNTFRTGYAVQPAAQGRAA